MGQQHLTKLKREIMDAIGDIDVETLATNQHIQNVINDIHHELLNVSMIGE
jgi:hypothetical protein